MARKASSPLRSVFRQPEPERHPAEDAFAFIGGIVLGALIGGVIAIFLAPTDGETLRRQVADRLGLAGGEAAGDEPNRAWDTAAQAAPSTAAPATTAPVTLGVSAAGEPARSPSAPAPAAG
jgi:hypothetical protein